MSPIERSKRARGTMARKPKQTSAPAKQYEPTEREAEVIAKYSNRSASRPKPPRMNVTISEHDGVKSALTDVDHKDQTTGYMLLASAIAVDDAGFLAGQLGSLANTANKLGILDELRDFDRRRHRTEGLR